MKSCIARKLVLELTGPLCESWALCLTEPGGSGLWDLCMHDSCWAIATGA